MEVDRPIKSANEECNDLHDQSIKVRDQNITPERQNSSEKVRGEKATRPTDVTANTRTSIATANEGSDQPNDENNEVEHDDSQVPVLDSLATESQKSSHIRTEVQEPTSAENSDSKDDGELDTMKNSGPESTNAQVDEEDEPIETPTISCKDEIVTDDSTAEAESDTSLKDAENTENQDLAVCSPPENPVYDQPTENANSVTEVEQCDSSSDSSENNDKSEEKPQIKEDIEDYHSLLFEVLNVKPKPKMEEYTPPVISLDLSTNVLSYERFYPGRILGNTFCVRNTGNAPASLSINFSNSQINTGIVCEKLCDYFGIDSINQIENTYKKHLKGDIDTSEENLS